MDDYVIEYTQIAALTEIAVRLKEIVDILRERPGTVTFVIPSLDSDVFLLFLQAIGRYSTEVAEEALRPDVIAYRRARQLRSQLANILYDQLRQWNPDAETFRNVLLLVSGEVLTDLANWERIHLREAGHGDR